MLRAAWASWRVRIHALRLLAWAAQVPIAVATDLKTSVAYLVFISLAALIETASSDLEKAVDIVRARRRGEG